MNENHFTQITKWQSRERTIPRLALFTTRMLRFVVLLCIGLYGQTLNAQCVDCSNVTGIPITVDCAEAIPSPEDLVIINPTCSGVLTFADGVVVAGAFTRTYTYTPTVGAVETCSHTITVNIAAAVSPTITCPNSGNDVMVALDPGACETIVFLDEPTVTDACGGPMDITVTSSPTAGLSSGSSFPIGTTTLTYTVVGADAAVPDLASCTVDVIVNEYSGVVSNLSLDDDRNISASTDCSVLITPALALGTNGSFPCFDNYTVTIDGLTPASAITNTAEGVLVDVSMLTLTNGVSAPFNVMVAENNTTPPNSTWGMNWTIEDKLPPAICCSDYSVSCMNPTAPITAMDITKTYENNTTTEIPAVPANSSFSLTTLEIEVLDCANPILSLNAAFDLTATPLTDFAIELVHPDGTTRTTLLALTDAVLPTMPIAVTAFNSLTADGIWTFELYNYGNTIGTLNAASIEIGADYANPIASDACSNVTLSSTDTYSGTICGGDRAITRVWTATDAAGMTATCAQTITFIRPELTVETLECPEDLTVDLGTALSCNDGTGAPDPSVTGQPKIDGQEIDGTCNFSYSVVNGLPYTDIVFPGNCTGNVTYKRTWMIRDNCTGVMMMCEQTIEIVDTEGPAMTCPANMDIAVGSDCTGATALAAPTMLDACSNENNTYTATTTAGTLTLLSGAYTLSDLANGATATITYTGSDACGNTNTCSFTVTASDQTSPVASCNFASNLSLDNAGNAMLLAESPATAGSTDNCGIVSYGIRIMNDCATPAQSTYASSVTLECCHAGQDVVVEFQVTDAAGNTNSCSSTISVSSFAGFGFNGCPSPAVTTVECDDLTSINSALTNVVSTGTVPVSHTDINGTVNASAGFYPTSGLLLSGCGSPTVSIVDVDMSTVCGGGTIVRTYTVTDGAQTSSCVVTYTVQNTQNPFDPNTIVWPLDYTSPGANCDATEPADLPTANSVPTFTTVDGCNDVWATKSDMEIPGTEAGTCYKILRTWSVSDDCNNSATPTTSNQIVMVVADAPVIPTCPGTQTLDIGGNLNLSITATNNCAQYAPVISYSIDINNDGATTADLTGTGGTITDVVGMVGSTFPVGSHTVTFSATACNNTTTCVVAVVVNDPCSVLAGGPFNANVGITGSVVITPDFFFGSGGAPANTTIDILNFTGTTFTCSDISNNMSTPYTVNVTLDGGTVCPATVNVVDNITPAVSVSTVPVNITADGTVNFADYQTTLFPGINDQCTDFANLDISYSPASVTCAGIAITETVTITIKDEFIYGVGDPNNGNPRVESVDVIVSCSTPPSASMVTGAISNEENEMLENVSVTPSTGMDISLTDLNGAFSMNLPTNENYDITPNKNDDHLNGVSTYDIVLISKHILQLELFDSPYKMIAGDVNKSGGITTLDMVDLRKVILFIDDEFTNNESWRFVDANYAFPNPSNPFEEIFPESYPINELVNDMTNLDFVAVKVGDVNGSAETNGFVGDADSRTNGTLEMEINDAKLTAGQTQTIDVTARDFDNLLGYQFTMAFEGLEIMDVIPGELTTLTAANFGMQRLQEGMLTTSWNSTDAVSLADGAVLFSLEVKATSDVNLSDALRASSRYTAAEAYLEKGAVVELLDVNFTFRNDNGTTVANQFELYQNRPNPFKDETVIGFELPQAGNVALKVYDISGRILTEVKGAYHKGYNEVSINRSDLPGAGVLYYELTTANNSAVRKMTIIE